MERLKGDLSKEVQSLAYLNDFVVSYSVEAVRWDKNKISKRSREMAEKAYREVWKIK